MKKILMLCICILTILLTSCSNKNEVERGNDGNFTYGEELTTTIFDHNIDKNYYTTPNLCLIIQYSDDGIYIGGYYNAQKNISVTVEYYRNDSSILMIKNDNFKIITPMQPAIINYDDYFSNKIISEISYVRITKISYTPLYVFKKGRTGEYPKYDLDTGKYLGIYNKNDILMNNYTLGEYGFIYDEQGNIIN